MNHIKEALKDKNGDAYIWLCVIVVFISMLLSVLILYMGLLSQVQIQKREVKTKLDSVVPADNIWKPDTDFCAKCF